MSSPNQVLTHAARAAAKQLNKAPFQAPLVAARGAREGLWLEQHNVKQMFIVFCARTFDGRCAFRISSEFSSEFLSNF